MSKFMKAMALVLSLVLCLSFPVSASAVAALEVPDYHMMDLFGDGSVLESRILLA